MADLVRLRLSALFSTFRYTQRATDPSTVGGPYSLEILTSGASLEPSLLRAHGQAKTRHGTLFPLTLQLRVGVFLTMIVVLIGVGVGCALGASAVSKTTGTGISSGPAMGKALYRTYCGQCHALTAADAAGFGSDNGLGQNGGPTFNNLEVPYNLAIVAVTEQAGPRGQEIGRRGHKIALEHMTWQQLSDTANFLAAATATNLHSARVSDGYTSSGR